MPTDARPINLFLFAHQDDEIGVFGEIEACVRGGERVVCIYLTDGGAGGVEPGLRNSESVASLGRFGIAADDLYFAGTSVFIPDGHLIAHFDRASAAVDGIVAGLGPICRIVMHAWEGGHMDHDAAHVIGVLLALRHGLVDASRQFTLYRNKPGSLLPFVVFQPLEANGIVQERPVPRRRLLYFLWLLTRYPSQRKTMIGLFPFMAAQYLLKAAQLLQPLDPARLYQVPHSGTLLYEKRTGGRYAEFRKQADPFIAKFELETGLGRYREAAQKD